MSRYIDADALKTRFENKKSTIQNRIMGGQMDSIAIAFYEIFIEAIDKQPTVDAVPVVRCCKCKHGITGHGVTDGYVLCSKPYTEKGNAMHRADWFCADGERKDGERRTDEQ